jgi:hypothetical protein
LRIRGELDVEAPPQEPALRNENASLTWIVRERPEVYTLESIELV